MCTNAAVQQSSIICLQWLKGCPTSAQNGLLHSVGLRARADI